MPTRFSLLFAALVTALLFCHDPVHADGKVFARVVTTTIPDQEALVYFKDGVETLAIETRFVVDGPATTDQPAADSEFAWVVPVPGAGGIPEVSATTRGVFPTLRHVFSPRVISNTDGIWVAAIALSLPFLLGCCVRFRSPVIITGMTLLSLILCVMLALPALGRARSMLPAADGVEVLERSFVGSFDVAIIAGDPSVPAADSGANLAAWLRTNHFDLPPGVESVLADYAARGWVFVASRLGASDSGPGARLAPHPLVFRFRTPEAVYPLVLTGTGGTSLAVDLYVFGDGLAAADGFRAVRCAPDVVSAPVDSTGWRPSIREPRIAHEELRRLVPESTTLTKLTATLTPDQMRRDATIRFEPPKDIGREVYSYGAAASVAAGYGGAVLVVASLVLAMLCVASRAGTAKGRIGSLMVVLASAAVAVGWYVTLPTAPTERASRPTSPNLRNASEAVSTEIARAREADSDFTPTADWIRARLAAAVESDARSRPPGRPARQVREEDSPFNYSVREAAPGRFELVTFDAYGVAEEPSAVFE
ncbi:MAG: DUF2330 domain-containing protein [Phycisphaeraceae bacterium]|nr:DUF2330 domain-containing protein [Phycisphaeraceae bacterium]